MEIIYAYVDGSDLELIEKPLMASFSNFVRGWGLNGVNVVNNRDSNSTSLISGDLPDWDLGLNVPIDQFNNNTIEKLVTFLGKLAGEHEIEFVVGYWNSQNQVSDDWCHIGKLDNQRSIEILKSQRG